MSVTVTELLDLAKDLRADPREVSWRGSISRGYYAAFHHADWWHQALPSAGEPPDRPGGKHHELACRLTKPTLASTDQRRALSVTAGYILREGHRLRVKADYFLNEGITAAETDQLLFSVRKLVATLS